MKDILSYEISKKLHDAGIVVESDYGYNVETNVVEESGGTIMEKGNLFQKISNGNFLLFSPNGYETILKLKYPNILIPAPTFLGLWDLLPEMIESEEDYYYKDIDGNEILYNDRTSSPVTLYWIKNQNLTEAAAEMLLRLKRESVI